MLAAADRAVVVADASKLGRTSLGVIGGLDRFELLITATPAGGSDTHLEEVARLELAGLQTLTA
jgi:DeoR family transcriptional regulator of aga operon